MNRPTDMLRDVIGNQDFLSENVDRFIAAYQAASPLNKIMLMGAFRAEARAGRIPPRQALFICGFVGGCDDISEEMLAKAKEQKAKEQR